MQNFGDYTFTFDGQPVDRTYGTKYVVYKEGIYVGYKWYETADHEGVWTAENGYPGGYDSVVQFPFGFGLSYTTFDWTVDDIKIDGESAEEGAQLKADSKVEFTVTVTNTGERAGRNISVRQVIYIVGYKVGVHVAVEFKRL